MAPVKMKTLYPLISGIAFLLVGLFFIKFLNQTMKKNALQEAEAKADIILHRNLSTHLYFSHELKPEVFRLTDSFREKNYFHPSWMSSTYAVRGIEKNFQKLTSEDYYYKECAINARSPENEADAYESAFIQQLNNDPDLQKKSEIRLLKNQHYFVILHRGEVMEESCLLCHSEYEKAPKGLVTIYGKERSFHRAEDEVVSAISIRIPLEIPYAAANTVSKKLSLYLFVLLALLFILLSLLSNRLLFMPLTYIRDKARLIISSPEHLGEEITLPFGQELSELTRSFNSLSVDLRQNRDHLEERVMERTRSLSSANEKLKELDRMKSKFLASMSHELRTPLNSILGYTQILIKNRAVTSGHESGLQTIQQSGEHLLALINDLLDLSKIEAGKMALNPTAINFGVFLDGLGNIIRNKAESKQLAFTIEKIGELPQGILADEVRLRQALLNLLGNAVKFTLQGTVVLRVQRLGPVDRGRQEFSIEVEDSGPGIPFEQLETIFLPFEQVGDLSTRPEGSGLGLAITQELIGLMGGKVKVKSTVGKGTVFYVNLVLPVVHVDEKALPSELNIIGYKGRSRSILIVDNRAENRMVLRDMLRPLGFEIELASNGREALRKAEQVRPDLVLMDLVMPVMTGVEAAQKMRKLAALKNTVIIALSTSVLVEKQESCLIMGCDAFLSNPISMKELLSALEKYLSLEWEYELVGTGEVASQPVESEVTFSEMAYPPVEKLQELVELARVGSMTEIKKWSKELKETDSKYTIFSNHLENLAKGFMEKEILAFIEQGFSGSIEVNE